jgi:hypothetical protein
MHKILWYVCVSAFRIIVYVFSGYSMFDYFPEIIISGNDFHFIQSDLPDQTTV